MRKVIKIVFFLMALFTAALGSAERDSNRLIDIVEKVENQYHETLFRNEESISFEMREIESAVITPYIANFSIGEHDEHLMRPAYIQIINLCDVLESKSAIDDYYYFVENCVRDVLESDQKTFRNEQVLREYSERNDVSMNPNALFTIPIYTARESIVSVYLFGVSHYDTFLNGTDEPFINNEIYAWVTAYFYTESDVEQLDGRLGQQCFLITDQSIVYELTKALGIDQSDNFAIRTLIKQFE